MEVSDGLFGWVWAYLVSYLSIRPTVVGTEWVTLDGEDGEGIRTPSIGDSCRRMR
jgi:hypothetical protein